MSAHHVGRCGAGLGGLAMLLLAASTASNAQAADLHGEMFAICRITKQMEVASDRLAMIAPLPRLPEDPIYGVAEARYPLLAGRIDEVRWLISETPGGLSILPDSNTWITWALSHDMSGRAC
jgi:hypothetical protein